MDCSVEASSSVASRESPSPASAAASSLEKRLAERLAAEDKVLAEAEADTQAWRIVPLHMWSVVAPVDDTIPEDQAMDGDSLGEMLFVSVLSLPSNRSQDVPVPVSSSLDTYRPSMLDHDLLVVPII